MLMGGGGGKPTLMESIERCYLCRDIMGSWDTLSLFFRGETTCFVSRDRMSCLSGSR
jgi:hypothetical protein